MTQSWERPGRHRSLVPKGLPAGSDTLDRKGSPFGTRNLRSVDDSHDFVMGFIRLSTSWTALVVVQLYPVRVLADGALTIFFQTCSGSRRITESAWKSSGNVAE